MLPISTNLILTYTSQVDVFLFSILQVRKQGGEASTCPKWALINSFLFLPWWSCGEGRVAGEAVLHPGKRICILILAFYLLTCVGGGTVGKLLNLPELLNSQVEQDCVKDLNDSYLVDAQRMGSTIY